MPTELVKELEALAPQIIIAVSTLSAAGLGFWHNRKKDDIQYQRDLKKSRHSEMASLYQDTIGALDQQMRYALMAKFTDELQDAQSVLTARLKLSAPLNILEQYMVANGLLVSWTNKYWIGEHGDEIQNNTKLKGQYATAKDYNPELIDDSAKQAREIKPKLITAIDELVSLMKEHLVEIEP